MKDEAREQLLDKITRWETNRRTVLKGTAIFASISALGFLASCERALEEGNDLLSAQEATILHDILDIFFPESEDGPSARDIHAFEYIMWVLHDDLNRKPSANKAIISGIGQVNEMANNIYFSDFTELNEKQVNALVETLMETSWGRTWSSSVITLILEALVLDPLYGGNPNEIGWEWLNHTPGFPRPTEEIRYERIMEKQMKITSST